MYYTWHIFKAKNNCSQHTRASISKAQKAKKRLICECSAVLAFCYYISVNIKHIDTVFIDSVSLHYINILMCPTPVLRYGWDIFCGRPLWEICQKVITEWVGVFVSRSVFIIFCRTWVLIAQSFPATCILTNADRPRKCLHVIFHVAIPQCLADTTCWPYLTSHTGNTGMFIKMMKTRHSYTGNPFLGTWISIAIV